MIIIVLPDTASDHDLLRQAQRGDQAAIKAIYQQYFDPIYQFIRLRVANRQTAEDLAGNVFLEFVRAIRKGKPPRKNLRAWLFRVARNELYDHYGERKQVREVVLGDWLPAAPHNDPELQFSHTADLQRIRRALLQLTEPQQELLLLRFGQLLNLEETADVMGKSVSAVKSLQFRAVRALRDELSQQDTDHE